MATQAVGSEIAIEERTLVRTATMQALVYHGPGRRSWGERPKPSLLAPTDAIVRMRTATICGTDLHILEGDVPTVTEGRILGHEGIGSVVEVGSAVADFHKNDLVLISCITSCGRCDFCRKRMYSHCRTGGWLLGNTIDGTQADYVRIPHADTSLHRLPDGADEESLVLLSDVFPTAYECAVQNGGIRPGDSVAIVGAGPIGLAALITAQFHSPAELFVVDPDAFRLKKAREFGATRVLSPWEGPVVPRILRATGGAGVDVVIEAVGTPEAFDVCQKVVAPGGRLANVGVHGKSVPLDLPELWSRNIALTTRLVDTVSTPMLLRMVQAGRLRPGRLATHCFDLAETMKAYDLLQDAAREQVLKVILKARA